MRSLTSSRPAWSVSRTSRAAPDRASRRSAPPTARRSASPGRTGSSRPRPTARPCARAGRAPWWPALDLLRHAGLGDLVRYSSTTEPESSPSSRWIDSICLRRKYSRCCCRRLTDVLADLPAQLQLGQPLALDADGELEPLGHVERLEDLDLLLERDVGGVADRVGQGAGLTDSAQPGADALVDATQLEDLLDDGAVLALEVAGAAVDRESSGCSVTSTRRRPRVAVGGARDAAGDAGELHGTAPPGSRTFSVTWAIVPTFANAPSWRGMSRTRSSSPTSTGSVTSMVGKTTVSSKGTRISEVISRSFTFCRDLPFVCDHSLARRTRPLQEDLSGPD